MSTQLWLRVLMQHTTGKDPHLCSKYLGVMGCRVVVPAVKVYTWLGAWCDGGLVDSQRLSLLLFGAAATVLGRTAPVTIVSRDCNAPCAIRGQFCAFLFLPLHEG